jgi:hypothetical protein
MLENELKGERVDLGRRELRKSRFGMANGGNGGKKEREKNNRVI